jgi:RluA family pseudouridine synthase
MNHTPVECCVVPPDADGMFFSDFARAALTTLDSRNGVKKAIKRGELLLDGRPALTGTRVRAGQQVALLRGRAPQKVFGLQLDVLYEDEHLAAVCKPAGFAVNGNSYRTVRNSLPGNLRPSREADALAAPCPLHRLDVPTSGVLLVAKTVRAMTALGHQFEERGVGKVYRAIVIGNAPDKGCMDTPVGGREAFSEYTCLHRQPSLRSGTLSLLELRPRTGRTHQLRIHCAQAEMPIPGDGLYGHEGRILRGKGLFLCAVSIEFTHPVDGHRINVECPMPRKFETFLERDLALYHRFAAQQRPQNSE